MAPDNAEPVADAVAGPAQPQGALANWPAAGKSRRACGTIWEGVSRLRPVVPLQGDKEGGDCGRDLGLQVALRWLAWPCVSRKPSTVACAATAPSRCAATQPLLIDKKDHQDSFFKRNL